MRLLGETSESCADLDAYRDFYRNGAHAIHPTQVEREGETVKFLMRWPDGAETESVILPIEGLRRTRTTLCVSSQAGCALGCRFCETAQLGLRRNLTAAEIVTQWHTATHPLGHAIDNIVFMGMGEPLQNTNAVIHAIAILVDRNGPAMACSRISVSTVGLPRGIERLATLAATPGFRQLGLAVSVNAPNDMIRASIMPIARSVSLEDLRSAMLRWPSKHLLAEYVLIPGVNDAPQHAEEICDYLRPIGCTLNVIPYNPRRDSPWPAPTEESVQVFIDSAKATGQFVTRRVTMGRGAMAACGQLAGSQRPSRCGPPPRK